MIKSQVIMGRMLDLKKILIYLQVFTFALTPVSYATSPTQSLKTNQRTENFEDSAKQVFLETELVETSQGPGRLETLVFDIENESDLAKAQYQILQKLEDKKVKKSFNLNVYAPGMQSSQLATEVTEAANRLALKISTEKPISPEPIEVSKPESFIKRHYNLTLGLVRFVANGATVAAGLIMGQGISPFHALTIGTLAGSISGIMQVKSTAMYNWVSNTVVLSKLAMKAGLIPKSKEGEISKTEHMIKEVEKYGRWGTLEAAFLLVCRLAMTALNIPVTENLFHTLGKSVGSQGLYEVGVLKTANNLEEINPAWKGKIEVLKNVAFFSGSAISVLAAIGSMIDMPFSNLGFVTLGVSGVVLNFGPKILKTQPMQKIIQRWKGRSKKCADLFSDAA